VESIEILGRKKEVNISWEAEVVKYWNILLSSFLHLWWLSSLCRAVIHWFALAGMIEMCPAHLGCFHLLSTGSSAAGTFCGRA